MKKSFFLFFFSLFCFLSRAQTILTFYPLELTQKTMSFKLENIQDDKKLAYGVFYSFYNKSKDNEYLGSKVCPFIRLYQPWANVRPNQHFYAQLKLIGGYFNSWVDYYGPDNAGGPNDHSEKMDYLTLGVGLACGMQLISDQHYVIDISVGSQYNPQLVEKTLVRHNTTYHYGTGGMWLSAHNTNLPWIVFGPGSILEIRLGIGLNN